MPNGPWNKNLRNILAFALANGHSVAKWAKEHEIPKRTCYEWAREDEFKREVAKYRRRVLDRATGLLIKKSVGAIIQIGKLSKNAKQESVQLQAARAILSNMLEVRESLELEERIDALEQKNTKED